MDTATATTSSSSSTTTTIVITITITTSPPHHHRHPTSQVLNKLGYDADPTKLQLIIRCLYDAVKRRGFDVPGTRAEPFALFEVIRHENTVTLPLHIRRVI